MKIKQITVDHYDIPLPSVLTDSTHGKMCHFAVVVARIKTESGAEGVGYTYTVGKTGGSAVRAHIERDLSPVLMGADPRLTEKLWQKMWWTLHYVGRGGAATFAISAVDIALWDLKAREAGEPLWRHLGGCDARVKVYAGGIDLEMPLDALREQTRQNLDRGYRAVKMKVGRASLKEDLARVAAVREVLGDAIPLMVDANMRWGVHQAIEASRALAEYGVYWLEEPTIPDDVEGHARIAAEGPLPVATGENLHTIYEFQKMIARGGVAFPEPDLSNLGGVTAWMKVAHLAEAHNLPVTTHGVHDLHVHLLAAVPNASYLEAHGFGLEAYIRHPMEIRDGIVVAPERPGHGVEFDFEKLEEHRAPE
jgi:L-alanine-DL-glutamate epimerase-like enolase superfamily enzyme